MSRHTKEKRKKQQLKKEAEVKEEKIVFDILHLLKHENLDTKPNMAKFLKGYVAQIVGLPKVKPAFYPVFDLVISKWFVKFLDGHELIYCPEQLKPEDQYSFCFFPNEIELSSSNRDLVKTFFDKLIEFKFLSVPKS